MESNARLNTKITGELISLLFFPLWFFQLRKICGSSFAGAGGALLCGVVIFELLYQSMGLGRSFPYEYGFVFGLFVVLTSRFAADSVINSKGEVLIGLAYIIALIPLLLTPSALSLVSNRAGALGWSFLAISLKIAYFIWLIFVGINISKDKYKDKGIGV